MTWFITEFRSANPETAWLCTVRPRWRSQIHSLPLHMQVLHIHILHGHSLLHMNVTYSYGKPNLYTHHLLMLEMVIFQKCMSVENAHSQVCHAPPLFPPPPIRAHARTHTRTKSFVTHRPKGWGQRTLTSQVLHRSGKDPCWPAFIFLFLLSWWKISLACF